MASFFGSSAPPPQEGMSPGVEKALAFLILAMIGRLLKPRFSQPQLAGVQRLIMDATLPCTIFKALCAVSLDYELLRWPLLGIAFVLIQLAAATLASKLFFKDAIRQQTALYQLATAAPGLSAFVFVKEFVGDDYAGPAGSRRPEALWCLHAIDATRVHRRRSWVVSFSILSRFGLRRCSAQVPRPRRLERSRRPPI